VHLAECTAARNGPMGDSEQPCWSLEQGRTGHTQQWPHTPFRSSAGREHSSTCAADPRAGIGFGNLGRASKEGRHAGCGQPNIGQKSSARL
jgi:hypothetical protein